MKLVLIVFFIAVIVVFLICLIFNKKTGITFVPVITMRDLIKYCKQPKISKSLSTDNSLIAVAIKESKKRRGLITIVCCIYNKKDGKILDNTNPLKVCAFSMDKPLKDSFGDKSMIVLK